MVRRIFAIGVIIVLSGCATKGPGLVTEDQILEETRPWRKGYKAPPGTIVEVDPDEIDRRLYGNLPIQETPPHVQVGKKDGVVITMDKQESEWHEQTQSHLQRWRATAKNTTWEDKCVTPMWRLMEFEYTSFGPSEQLIPAYNAKVIGEFHQRTWQLGDVWLAPAPSGYLHEMRVRGTVPGAKVGEECNWITPDEAVDDNPREDIDLER